MKLLKKIFYGIVTVIMLLCVGILVCALNPSLTQSLAENLNGELTGAQIPVVGESILPADGDDRTGSTASGNGMINVGYIAPSEDAVATPEQVYGMSGYEPVRSNEVELLDEAAEQLRDNLVMGDVGGSLTFDTEIYPYYGMLDYELQQLYRQIYANAIKQRESFAPVITVNTERLRDVFEAVYNDHPELFWLDTEYSCKYTQKGICVEISLKYNETVENFEEAQEKFEAQARVILDGASKQLTDYDRELYVHDALVKRVEYNTKADMSQSAYSALVNGESVCAGYARAFQYLMQQLNIPCYYCTGYSGEEHAWNIVKIKNNFYNVDVTWADTKPATYDYFNKTDIDYAKTHVRKGLSVYLPACNGATVTTGGWASTESGVESNLDAYINPDPQQPLTYPEGMYMNSSDAEEAGKKQENLDKAGITEDDVLDDMTEYYADCLEQMIEVGSGQKYFINVIPESLWSTIEQAYSQGSYEAGYVTEALKKLEKEYFAIQLQVEDISGGYYRIYHNISTW